MAQWDPLVRRDRRVRRAPRVQTVLMVQWDPLVRRDFRV